MNVVIKYDGTGEKSRCAAKLNYVGRRFLFRVLKTCAPAGWVRGLKKGKQHLAAQVEILFDPMIRFVSHLHIFRYYLSALVQLLMTSERAADFLRMVNSGLSQTWGRTVACLVHDSEYRPRPY